MEGHLQTAMKAVGQAIQEDGDGKNREAYFRYLACIQYISQAVLEDSKNQGYQGPIKTKSTARMLKLAQQCMDRASAIMENIEEDKAAHLAPPPIDQSGRFSPSIRSFESSPLQPSKAEQSQSATRPHEPPSAVNSMTHRTKRLSGESQGGMTTTSLPVPVGYTRPPATRKDKLTPLEAAYLENQRLMNAYKARLTKLMETNKGKGQLRQTNLNLTLQRRLMENMAIARAREAALAKKIQERHQRLQEEAARRFSTTGEPTRAEIELRQIYANVMEFESNEVWLSEWRQKLHETPGDLKFIHALISHILSCPNHPFTQLLKKFQYAVYQSLLPLVKKDANELQQIRVPYKAVEPLLLAGSKPKVIPPNGFASPEDLVDKNVDKDLMRRLHALRSSSDNEQRESLYGDMLAASSSLDEDDEDDLWDELNSGDDTLEDGIGEGPEEASDGQEITVNSGSASVRSQVSIEVEEPHNDMEGPPDRDAKEGKTRVDGDGDAIAADASSSIQDLPVEGMGDHQEEEKALKEEETEAPTSEAEGDTEENIGKDNILDRMKRISMEVQEDLKEAVVEGEELTKYLERQIEEDLEKGQIVQNEDADNTDKGSRDDSQDDVASNTGDGHTDEVSETSLRHEEYKTVHSKGEVDNTQDYRQESEDSAVSEHTASAELDSKSRRQEGGDMRQEAEKTEETKKEEDEQERIARLQEDALQRHLKHISKDIQSYLDRLLALLVAIYEELDSAVAKEQCIAVIEKHFFHFIWQPLLTLFRRSNLRKEITAAIAMTKYRNALPENIGIIDKLCLVSDEGAAQNKRPYPYQLAVEELRRISGYYSPLEKLECVVKASRAIITCVGDYYEAQGRSRESTENAVGCDDLLPILSYVIIKSALPHIVSECSIMEEFIHEGYLFGEEGYCLTTLQTSLGYVLKLAED